MSVYVCEDCGRTFDENEVMYYKERHGFNDGFFEKIECCPYCRGRFDEADVCEDCGCVFSRDENALYAERWCENCLRNRSTREELIDYIFSERDFAEDFAEWLAERG